MEIFALVHAVHRVHFRIVKIPPTIKNVLLIAAALVGVVEMGELHIRAWMVVLIISREFLITGLRSLAASRGIVMAADGAGKFKMASQITAIIIILKGAMMRLSRISGAPGI